MIRFVSKLYITEKIKMVRVKKDIFKIADIPAIIWGEPSEKVIIAVHGNMSNKADIPIEIVVKNALARDYQVLSFDLPAHGDRIGEYPPCKVQYCVKDLVVIMKYAKEKWKIISLFANSMGAYFSLLAYANEPLERVWFLSPVVDMRRIIENMMTWFSVTEEELELKQTISTPIGQDLYWDYYCFVKEHPVSCWKVPTSILYGSKDELCEKDIIIQFTKKFSCELEVVEDAEHYFHTPKQLEILDKWIRI